MPYFDESVKEIICENNFFVYDNSCYIFDFLCYLTNTFLSYSRKELGMIKISKIGFQFLNVKGFEINRPYGSGDYLFLHFRCPTEVFLNGAYQTLPENTFFL